MAYEQRDGTGALFKAKEQPTDKHPGYTGSCLIGGKKYSISAWVNESKSGEKYFSLKLEEPRGREANQEPAKAKPSDPLDGDFIPF